MDGQFYLAVFSESDMIPISFFFPLALKSAGAPFNFTDVKLLNRLCLFPGHYDKIT